MVAAAAFLIAPGWEEPVGTVTNIQWIMAPALLALILNSSSISRSEGVIFALMSSLTGPFSAIFIPIIVAVVFIKLYRSRSLDWIALTAGAGGFVQAVLIISRESKYVGQAPEAIWLLNRLLELPFSYAPYVIAAYSLLFLTLLVGQRRWVRLGFMFGVLLMTTAVFFKFYDQPRIFETGSVGQRYWYVQGVLWMLIGATALTERALLAKLAGACGLLMMLWNVPEQPLARAWQWPTEDWRAFIMRAHEGPAVYRHAPGWDFHLDLGSP